MKTQKRIEALAKALDCAADDITRSTYDECAFDACGGEYLVLTDEEADKRTREYIKETLWAFNSSFIASHSTKAWSDRCVCALKKMQSELCEDANPIVEALIQNMDSFVFDAIRVDGRGHFLSQYDGDERECGEYYIYRTN